MSLIALPSTLWRCVAPGFPGWALWLVVAMSVGWSVLFSAIEAANSWREGQLVSWFWRLLLGESLSMLAVAFAFVVPIALSREHGPRSGWRRYLLLVIVVALALLLACLVRLADLKLALPPTQEMSLTPLRLWRWCERYAAAGSAAHAGLRIPLDTPAQA